MLSGLVSALAGVLQSGYSLNGALQASHFEPVYIASHLHTRRSCTVAGDSATEHFPCPEQKVAVQACCGRAQRPSMLRMTLIAQESQGSSGSLYDASQLMHICEYQRFREGDRQTFKTPFMQAGGILSAFMVPLQGHRSWTACPASTDAVLTDVVGEEQDVPSPPQTPHLSFLALPPHRPKQSTCTRHLPSQFLLVFG